jgi:autotransporter-associated beta strand protein
MSGASLGFWRLSGPINGGGNVTYNAGMNHLIEGNNTYTGTTTIGTTGTLAIGSDTAFGNGGTLTFGAAASLVAFGGNRTIANPVNWNVNATNDNPTTGNFNTLYQGYDLTFSGTSTINATRTFTTFGSGKLTLTNVSDGGGGFGLVKTGGGTLVLAGANNTYSGTTAVNAGTLMVNGTLAAGGGLVTVASGAWLAGGGTINRDVTVSSGAFIKPGSSPGRLTIGGNVTMSATPATYYWELGANTTSGGGTNWSQITMTSGDLNVQSGAILLPAFVGTSTQPNGTDAFWLTTQRWDNIIDLTGTSTNSSGQTSFVINNSAWSAFGSFSTINAIVGRGIALQWTPVPEPAHIFLLGGAGTMGVGWWRRQRRSKLNGTRTEVSLH